MADRIRVEAPGDRDEYIDFKGSGWKFKHRRLWEDAQGSGELAEVISERIEGWHLLDEDGKDEIPFEPGWNALDEVPSDTVRWLVGVAFLKAYTQSGKPDPNE